jgi:hypothetical protein
MSFESTVEYLASSNIYESPGAAGGTYYEQMSGCEGLSQGARSADYAASVRQGQLYTILYWHVSHYRPFETVYKHHLTPYRPTDNDGVACKHGPEECMGNIIELCAADMYPDPKTYLGFTMCLTREYQDIPQRSLVEDCALEHGIDFGKLNECAVRDDGGFGMGMLRDSVRRSTDVSFVTFFLFLGDCLFAHHETVYIGRYHEILHGEVG